MLVKQIDRKTALELAAKGVTVNILAPSTPDPQEWMDYEPDTLDNLLDKCPFFRQVPAVENEAFEAAVRDMISEGCCENAADSDKALPGSQPEPGPSEEPSGGGIPRRANGKSFQHQTEEGRYRKTSGAPEGRMEHEKDRRGTGHQRRQRVQLPEEAGRGRGREADCKEREGR